MIYLGADHGGYEAKEMMKSWLTEHGYEWEDVGNTVHDPDDDYPVYAFRVAEHVLNAGKKKSLPWKTRPKGILACRSAAGVVIAANKVKGIYAAAVMNESMVHHAREHNDVNIIALSGDWTDPAVIGTILQTFLQTEASEESRHLRRREMISSYESDHLR